jgi:hypothetical protein
MQSQTDCCSVRLRRDAAAAINSDHLSMSTPEAVTPEPQATPALSKDTESKLKERRLGGRRGDRSTGRG